MTLDAPSELIVENTTVQFTCIADRVRPEPLEMYIVFTDDFDTKLGVRNTALITDEGVFRDVVVLDYTAVHADARRTLQCILDMGPVAGTMTNDYPLSIMCKYHCG